MGERAGGNEIDYSQFTLTAQSTGPLTIRVSKDHILFVVAGFAIGQ